MNMDIVLANAAKCHWTCLGLLATNYEPLAFKHVKSFASSTTPCSIFATCNIAWWRFSNIASYNPSFFHKGFCLHLLHPLETKFSFLELLPTTLSPHVHDLCCIWSFYRLKTLITIKTLTLIIFFKHGFFSSLGG